MFIYLDESGEFTKRDHGEYFVIASFTVGDQKRTNKEFRKWFKTKFPKRMRNQSEIKWSSSGIQSELRIKTIRYIAKLDIRIRFGYFLRKNIPSSYRKKNKIESGILYTKIVSEVLEKYLPSDEKEIHIFCDRRSLKGMTRQIFEKTIKTNLLPYCSQETLIQVEMIDSTSNTNMQIVDWVAGALAFYFEDKEYGEDYYKILKNNFLSDGIEFFK